MENVASSIVALRPAMPATVRLLPIWEIGLPIWKAAIRVGSISFHRYGAQLLVNQPSTLRLRIYSEKY
ncbi:unnamed protein product [Colias eurytheme]|nr:unnamed protein product [Colias eurytheme]